MVARVLRRKEANHFMQRTGCVFSVGHSPDFWAESRVQKWHMAKCRCWVSIRHCNRPSAYSNCIRREQVQTVLRKRQHGEGQWATQTGGKKSQAQVLLAATLELIKYQQLPSQGHPWQSQAGSAVSIAGCIYGPYWPIWQEAL